MSAELLPSVTLPFEHKSMLWQEIGADPNDVPESMLDGPVGPVAPTAPCAPVAPRGPAALKRIAAWPIHNHALDMGRHEAASSSAAV
jgi:hypothetical protein